MLKPPAVYLRDRETRTPNRGRRLIRRTSVFVSTALLSLFFYDLSLDFLASVLAVLSILAGFGFNVLVFLTNNRPIGIPASAKIERRLKIERVNSLGTEIFYNISYFNTVAVICIAVALAIAATKAFNADQFLAWWHSKYELTTFGRQIYLIQKLAFPRIAAGMLYLFVIEAIISFMRLIFRATYYFEQKIALSARVDQASGD